MIDRFSFPVARLVVTSLPVMLAVFAVILVNVPVSISGGMIPAPLLALCAVYFWSLMRPDLMPPSAILIIGLLEDLLSGGPPGLWAAGYLAAYAFTNSQRETLAGLSGIGAVIGFGAAMFVAATVTYILAAVVYSRLPPVGPVFLSAAVTIVFYPLVALVLGWLQRRVLGPMRGEL